MCTLNIKNIFRKTRDTQSLYVSLNKIKKITNLEQFDNLIELHIQNNKIKSLDNLPKFLLKLDISNNELKNLNNLSKSINLEYL